MDSGPPPYLQHNLDHNSAGGATYFSRMDNHSDPWSAYGCYNDGDTTQYSNHGAQCGPYFMHRNRTSDPSVHYGRPSESYGYPAGPFWYPYLHQQYSFTASSAQPPPPYAPPSAYMQQRNYSYPYCAPQPPSALAMVPVTPREPLPPYTSSMSERRLAMVPVPPREHRLQHPAEHRNAHVSQFTTSSLNLSSDELDLRRKSVLSGQKWDDDEASFYADVKFLSPCSSVMSDEDRKGKKSPSDVGPRGLTVGDHLRVEPKHTVQNGQLFHQKSLKRKQDNNCANVVAMETRLESEMTQKKTKSAADKLCYSCAELPWNKWASARPVGQRPIWSDLHHLSITELDATITCFIKDYPQLMSSDDSQQTSEFIKKSLEEMENYLRIECHRNECQFLSDSPNQNFPLISSALENSLRQMKCAGNTAKTGQQKRQRRSNITSFHEADLWAKGILGINNSVILLTTVHFYVSKCFGVRRRQEHQALRLDHFHFGEDPEGRYVRFEYDSNEADLSVTKNMISIKQYDDLENPRSVYKIIKIYVNAIENKVTLRDFYRKPNNIDNGKISFSWSALAVSEISGLIPRAMQKAGHEGYFNTLSFRQSVRNILKASGLPSAIHELRAGVRSPSLLAGVLSSGSVSNDTEVFISRLLDPPKPNNHSPLISTTANQQYHNNNDLSAEIPDTCNSGKLVSQATQESSRPVSVRSCGKDPVDNTVKESTTAGSVGNISDGRSSIENLEKVFHTLSTSFIPPKDCISSPDEFDSSNDSLEIKSPAPAMDISTHANNVGRKSSNSLDDIDPSSFVDITLDSPDDAYLLVISEGNTITLTEEYPSGFKTVKGDMSETLAASDTDSPPLVNLSGQSDPLLTSTPRAITPSVTPQRPSADTLSASPGLLMECYDDSENDDNRVPVVPATQAERIQPTDHDNSPALYSGGSSELTCPPPKKRKIDHNKENKHDHPGF